MSNPKPTPAPAKAQEPNPRVRDVDLFVPQSEHQPSPEYRHCVEALMGRQWRLSVGSFWTQAMAPRRAMPMQGWKLHVSALPETALETLRIVAPLCMARGIEFKFASDPSILKGLLSKTCARQSSGKFMTIYAPSEEQFLELAEALHPLLRGKPGPFILSDRRYKDSQVLHYRYGGFHSMVEENPDGSRRMCILGREYAYVEDVRAARYVLPNFVSDALSSPAPIAADEPAVSSKEQVAQALFGGSYRIDSVIRYSNAGGIYNATDVLSGEALVIKEARPYVGVDDFGTDSMARLRKEQRILQKIAHEGIAPRPREIFQEWEHIFLPIEKIPGQSLRAYMVANNPLIHNEVSAAQMLDWMRKTVQIVIWLLDCVATLHRHDIVFGDLSLNNVIIEPETLKLRLIDFEGAFEPGIDPPTNLFTPGYGRHERMRRDDISAADDIYALGCMMLAMMAPNPTANQLTPHFATEFASAVQAETGLPQAYVDCMLKLLSDAQTDLGACADALRRIEWPEQLPARSLAQFGAEADPDFYATATRGVLAYQDAVMDVRRQDRVFPVASKLSDPLAVDRGMLGIAYARQCIQGSIPETLGDWIQRRFSTQAPRPGLMNGLSGSAWVLSELGLATQARAALKAAGMHALLFQNMSLGYGVAGHGLAHLRLWSLTREAGFLREARKMADILCEAAIVRPQGLAWEDPDGERGAGVGWMEGASGIALFLLYAFCVSGDERYLRVGEQGLRFDMAQGRETGASLGFPRRTLASDTILMPYLEHGSAGVGTVVLRYLAVTRRAEYADFLARIKSSVAHKYAVLPGLFSGLAGLGNYLLDAHQLLKDPSYLGLAHRAAQGIKLFRVPRGDGLVFPGLDQGKLTCDYAEGSAGIALFLHRLQQGSGNFNFMLDETLEQGRLMAQAGTLVSLPAVPVSAAAPQAEPQLQSA
jgi:serine/threonine protein kinase